MLLATKYFAEACETFGRKGGSGSKCRIWLLHVCKEFTQSTLACLSKQEMQFIFSTEAPKYIHF